MYVSCLMATYNRGKAGEPLIAEAVESFLRQTHPAGKRDLLILNDTPGQTVVCDAPGVTVFNEPRRYPTLADKYNALAQRSDADCLAVWDDDDISLPHRLEFSLSKLRGGLYWHTTRHVFASRGCPWCYGDRAVGHNAALFRRKLWGEAGGFRGDAEWDQNFQLAVAGVIFRRTGLTVGHKPLPENITDAEVYYVYRWGVSPCHVSGVQDGYARRGQEVIEPGEVVVNPRWREDYSDRAARLVGRNVEY
jgi:glycosyltransferase involved in cell wall biosynthesis